MKDAKPSAGMPKRLPRSRVSSGEGGYEARAEQLVQAIGISAEVVRASKRISAKEKKLALEDLEETRLAVLHPAAAFRNLSSLRYQEQEILEPWDEESSEDADLFWQRSAAAGLAYTRRDTLREVLKRGRIANAAEYELVADLADMARETGKVTEAEAEKLSELIGAYESRR